ncbi:hypothetical protein JANAI62_11580 [Jannaschia pagri]|uniref:Uncharacterized protein n=1 Tax=Jannaschia pagri TaxID=2829797 RepID=A0ABQ4NJE1_9RHOB|nr:hypothetical protein [Jannaschia sp. AI_62]GIT90703.1 hypothetical protein JANAI61_11610 [Jannaschia sp. AI_61]GIT94535.1 hypothetical protein JANAI62_11580 [Jannaschia sp. AI_62]
MTDALAAPVLQGPNDCMHCRNGPCPVRQAIAKLKKNLWRKLANLRSGGAKALKNCNRLQRYSSDTHRKPGPSTQNAASLRYED